MLFKSFRNVSNTNQKMLGLRNDKEEADKEVGWPDPNPGATQLDLPTGICPHAPLHSSYPPSPSRYARMLRQPHECHFKLHTGASLMDSRTTQAGGIYDKIFLQERKFQSIILRSTFGSKFFQQFQIGSSTLWMVDVAKSLQISTGHRALVVILRGNKSFQANTRGKCFMFC